MALFAPEAAAEAAVVGKSLLTTIAPETMELMEEHALRMFGKAGTEQLRAHGEQVFQQQMGHYLNLTPQQRMTHQREMMQKYGLPQYQGDNLSDEPERQFITKINREKQFSEPPLMMSPMQGDSKQGPSAEKIVGIILLVLAIIATGLILWFFLSPSSMASVLGDGITGMMTTMADMTASGITALTSGAITIGGSVVDAGSDIAKATHLDDAGKGIASGATSGIKSIKKIKNPF